MATKNTLPVTVDGEITTTEALRALTDPTYQLPDFERDPETVQAEMDARVLSAESVDDLFGERAEALHAKDYIGRPFLLSGIAGWRPSDQPDGGPVFVVLDIVTADGEKRVMTTGARAIMLRVAKASQEGWLPLWVRVVEDPPTAAGYRPLNLARAEAPSDTGGAF